MAVARHQFPRDPALLFAPLPSLTCGAADPACSPVAPIISGSEPGRVMTTSGYGSYGHCSRLGTPGLNPSFTHRRNVVGLCVSLPSLQPVLVLIEVLRHYLAVVHSHEQIAE